MCNRCLHSIPEDILNIRLMNLQLKRFRFKICYENQKQLGCMYMCDVNSNCQKLLPDSIANIMESPIKSKISHPKRKQSGKKKFKIKRQAERRRSLQKDKNALSTNAIHNQVSKVSNIMTEFDEAERLCLPHYNFLQTTSSRVDQVDYPKHYDVDEYQNMKTAVERRKYRHSKDLRNNLKNNTDDVPQHSEHRICNTQLRGQKCDDETCLFKHDLRLPRKLRLCSDWKNGFCALGELCLHLHSEFPCRVHYLGLTTVKHDPNTCRYHHGGPLPKEYEDMFLNSLDVERHPMSMEMYRNRVIRLKVTVTEYSTIAEPKSDVNRCGDGLTEEQETEKRDILPAESDKPIEPAGKNVVMNDRYDACEEKVVDMSDESCCDLKINEETLD